MKTELKKKLEEEIKDIITPKAKVQPDSVTFLTTITILNLGSLKQVSSKMCNIEELPNGSIKITSIREDVSRYQIVRPANIACVYYVEAQGA